MTWVAQVSGYEGNVSGHTAVRNAPNDVVSRAAPVVSYHADTISWLSSYPSTSAREWTGCGEVRNVLECHGAPQCSRTTHVGLVFDAHRTARSDGCRGRWGGGRCSGASPTPCSPSTRTAHWCTTTVCAAPATRRPRPRCRRAPPSEAPPPPPRACARGCGCSQHCLARVTFHTLLLTLLLHPLPMQLADATAEEHKQAKTSERAEWLMALDRLGDQV